MSEVAQVPQLRFPEFNGDLEEKKLDDVGSFKSGTGFTEAEQGGKSGVPFFKVSDMNLEGNQKVMVSANNYVNDEQIARLNYKPINKKSVIFAKVGAAVFLERKRIADSFLIDNNMMAFTPTEDIDFIRQWFDTVRLSKYAQVGALPSYNASDLKTIKINLPSLPEQTKIANFLAAVDTKIEQLSKKQALLGEYKKGLMQQIFSQATRFKADDDSEFPDWEERVLGDYLAHKSKKNKNNEVDLVLSVSNKKGFITQDEQFDGYQVASKDLTNYKIVEKGEYAYNPSRINVGSIARLKNNTIGIVSPMYVVFKLKNLDSIFFDNLYQTHLFKHLIKVGCSGSVRDSLNFNDMADFVFSFPSLEEQAKIANFLSSIDSKIEQVGKQLDESKQFKKALLQQMFV